MTKMFQIDGEKLTEVPPSKKYLEKNVEDWIANDVGLLGLDILIIGRQVQTDHGKWLDLLAIDSSGGLVILELKKKRTPREIVAQVLDYASWVRNLTAPRICEIAEEYLKQPLSAKFSDHFGEIIPDRLNGSHSMLIVASEFDPASRRIVEYLAEEHGVSINTLFFDIFEVGNQQFLTTDTLLDQAEVEERSERKTQARWSGYWYVNGGQDHRRSWKDMVEYGFVSAGGGVKFSRPLQRLQPGSKIFVYQTGKESQTNNGYVGFGEVTGTRVLAKDFETNKGPLFKQKLDQPGITSDVENLERAEYVVPVRWIKTFDLEDAKWFTGGFANQNVVCKLRHPETVEFLLKQFEVDAEE